MYVKLSTYEAEVDGKLVKLTTKLVHDEYALLCIVRDNDKSITKFLNPIGYGLPESHPAKRILTESIWQEPIYRGRRKR